MHFHNQGPPGRTRDRHLSLKCTPKHEAKFHKELGGIIEKFLEYGADPYFRIFIPKKEHDVAEEQEVAEKHEGWDHDGCEITLERDRRKIMHTLYIAPPIY